MQPGDLVWFHRRVPAVFVQVGASPRIWIRVKVRATGEIKDLEVIADSVSPRQRDDKESPV